MNLKQKMKKGSIQETSEPVVKSKLPEQENTGLSDKLTVYEAQLECQQKKLDWQEQKLCEMEAVIQEYRRKEKLLRIWRWILYAIICLLLFIIIAPLIRSKLHTYSINFFLENS